MVNGFIFSTEFEAKNLNNIDFIQTLYRTLFDRKADVDGLAYWNVQLEMGMSRKEFVNILMHSQEHIALASIYGIQIFTPLIGVSLYTFVEHLYSAVLNRKADEEGLNYWVSNLYSGNATGADIATGFIFSLEYNETSKDNITFITTLYKAFFNREPDNIGLDYWIVKLNQGLNRKELVNTLLHSPEFISLASTYHIQAFKGAIKPAPFKGVLPVAIIKGIETFRANQGLLLSGESSYDSDGVVKCYRWKENANILSREEILDKTTHPIGKHTIRLTVIDNDGLNASKSVMVNVTLDSNDNMPPVVNLNGESNVTLVQGATYTELGATAIDAVDGNVDVRILGSVDVHHIGRYTLLYIATDKAGNVSSIKRIITVVKATDTIPPLLTLNGTAHIVLRLNQAYVELGASAVDTVDGHIDVRISGSVDSSVSMVYSITYTATDKAGNTSTKIRRVEVLNSSQTEINKLKEILDDPSIPYTTDADFNKTEYAKHHLADNEAKKLERTHMLVATATDPDPEWFYTDVDKSVIVTDAGTEHTIHLKKMRKDGTVYDPVDNDKLRLVVRVQRSKDNFEYITNVNIDQYAHWDGAGILKINVPQDLDKGRLIVGIRPSFDDVATSAIAERWSALITAEVWQVKAGVTEVDSSNVLFPIDDTSLEYLSAESKFTRNEIFEKVTEQMHNQQLFTFPLVVKNMSLQKDDMVSYIFKDSPRAGKVIAIEHRGNQDFILLAPDLFEVYDIVDIENNSMINEGISPEHVVIREGDRLISDQNESDPVRFEENMTQSKSIGGVIDFFIRHCSEGDALLTFTIPASLSPLDIGLDVGLMGVKKETKCTFEASSKKMTIRPSYFGGIASWVLRDIMGAKVELQFYGNLELVTKDAFGFGFDAGYTIVKGGHFTPLSTANIGSRNLEDKATKGSGEVSINAGVKMTIVGVSLPEFGARNSFGKDIGLEGQVGLKGSVAATAKNASEVEISSSSEYAINAEVDGKVGLTLGLKNIFRRFNIDIKTEKPFSIPLMKEVKGVAEFSFNSVYDNGEGTANLVGLHSKYDWMNTFLPNQPDGVLSPTDKLSSVWNEKSEDIHYDTDKCNDTIVSPAIACAGWMCGMVDKPVTLCKGKLTISEVIASARVGQKASTGASVINKAGELDVTVSGSPLVPQTTSFHMLADSAEYVVFEQTCTAPGVVTGTSTVTVGSLSGSARNILTCYDDENKGDPHIVTGDGLGYDFYASGDYILSRIPDVSGYEIQGRFLPGHSTSWPQAVALEVGGDRVEIQGRNMNDLYATYDFNALLIWVNGKEYKVSNHIIKLPAGGLIAIEKTFVALGGQKYAARVTVIWPEGSPAEHYGVVLNVASVPNEPFVEMLIARPDDYAGQERGLLGNNDNNPTNDFIRRNGEVLGVDHNMSFTELYALFGTDWLVRPYESLFRNPDAIKPQFPTDVVTLTPEQRALGEQACRALRGFYREACIIDVGLTGRAEIVKEYYANTEDLNHLSDAIVTPDADAPRYSMQVADKAYEADSGYYLHYKQDIHISYEAGEGKFMLLVRPPRGATAVVGTNEGSHVAEGNYSTTLEVDCTELNALNDSAFLLSAGSLQLWLQDPLSGVAKSLVSEVALPCTDASKRAGFSLHRGAKVELDDSYYKKLHYTQPLSITHTNSYEGEYILEVTPPTGAVVKLNESSTELSIVDSIARNDTLELDCSLAERNASDGSLKLWEKDKLSGAKAYNYASYALSCHMSKVLQTGQTTSYTAHDDGDYQTGEVRSYTRDNTKEVVTDNATGLMWQDNGEAKTLLKHWVTAANYNARRYNDTSGDTATTYCTNLTLGGYEDWRLPTRKELASIVDFGRVNPSLDPEFLNVASYYYWSSTTYAGYSGNAWIVHFNRGFQNYNSKNTSSSVLCVRAGQ